MIETTVALKPEYIVGLSILASVSLILMWGLFGWAVVHSSDSVIAILHSASFFKTATVVGVIAATVILSLAGGLEGNIVGAILSGIAVYVLGHLSNKQEPTEK